MVGADLFCAINSLGYFLALTPWEFYGSLCCFIFAVFTTLFYVYKTILL
jgi:hypothetical protein